MRDHLTFFRQFRKTFKTTGSIAPSSRFLAYAMIRPLKRRDKPARILEVGPGTGAVTRYLVRQLKPEDTFDLVELNPEFAGVIRERFESDPHFQRVAKQSTLHECALQDYEAAAPYDFIISGLPLNNFPPELVASIYQRFLELMTDDATLSYFEYMFMRSVRRRVSGGKSRKHMAELNDVINPFLSRHRVKKNWVTLNFPPAWVHHLKKKPEGSPAPSA